jgi:hypothetical protein
MAQSFRKAHRGGDNPQARAEGDAMEKDIWKELHSEQRDVPYHQGDANPALPEGSISGYKSMLPDADVARVSRPVTEASQLRAKKTVVQAKQGLQTFGNFTTADPFDEEFSIRKEVIDPETGIIPGIGKVYSGSDDPIWQYAARKQAQQFHDQYKQFIFSQVDLTRPESRVYWEKKFPEYVKSLRDGLRKNRMLRARLEDIGLYGVQNEEDMWLLYLSESKNAEQEKYLLWDANRTSFSQNTIAENRANEGSAPILGSVAGSGIIDRVIDNLRNFIYPGRNTAL